MSSKNSGRMATIQYTPIVYTAQNSSSHAESRSELDSKKVSLVTMIATDPGEPGRHEDTFSLVIKNSLGKIVAEVSGDLDGGNIQSTRLGR